MTRRPQVPREPPPAGPDTSPPTAYVAYQLRLADQLLTKLFERQLRLAGVESSFPAMAVLTALAGGQRLSGAELARTSLVTPQTMNGMLRVIEAQGWVKEGADAESARRRLWRITRKGLSTLQAAQTVLAPQLAHIDAVLGPNKPVVQEALADLITALQRLSDES